MGTVRKAKITSKGQVTIPLEVRKALNLRVGDVVTFVVEDGSAHLHPDLPEDPFAQWAGALRQGKGKTLKEISEDLRKERGW